MTDDPITAYHGSPHDFDQFDTSKIGTGEGAQAYGHGLYFAGNEPVAKGYRDALSGVPPEFAALNFGGRNSQKLARTALDDALKSGLKGDEALDAAMLALSRQGDEASSTAVRQPNYDAVNALGPLRGKPWEVSKGHMYEVHIDAHPDHMLDWDKPLSEQSPHIVKSIFDARKDNPTLFNVFKPHLEKDSTGMGFYQSLATHHPNGYQGASDFLQRAGIPGIRYLDAGSRSAQGDPTHNYVVFDHNRVSVKRKYEQGGYVDGIDAPSILESQPPIEIPRSLKELQNWQKTHSRQNRPSMDDVFTARMSGFEGATPISMPANLTELQAYTRTKRATGGRIPEVDKLFKAAKRTLDGETKPMLNMHDDDIVKALRVAQRRI